MTSRETLVRYWFKFDLTFDDPHPGGVLLGCGVTAYSYDDAVALLKERLFVRHSFPKITKVTENVDVSTLDQNHVLPNMEVPIHRGIWFPRGY
jgi:hypothetical protein